MWVDGTVAWIRIMWMEETKIWCLIAVDELSKEAQGLPRGERMGIEHKLRMGGLLGKIVPECFQVPEALNCAHLEPVETHFSFTDFDKR